MQEIRIDLSEQEMRMAAYTGVEWRIHAILNNYKPKVTDKHPWHTNIEGAMGELVYAKACNRYWRAGVNTFKRVADVDRMEVRTRSEPWHELLIRPDDIDTRIFVLITGQCPTYFVRGYFRCGEAKQHQEWLDDKGNNGAPAYFVPHAYLHDFTVKEKK
jgi:hypothetical protein